MFKILVGLSLLCIQNKKYREKTFYTMKITILVSVILFILNACQGRNMPAELGKTKQVLDNNQSKIKKPLKKPIAKIVHKKDSFQESKKVEKVKVAVKKRSTIKKVPLAKKSQSSNFPVTEGLPPLPVLPSIKESQKVHVKKQAPKPVAKQITPPSHTEEDITNTIMTKIPLPKESFSGGGMLNGLDMATIRIGKSPDYTSIILDSYLYEGKNVLPSKKAPVSGTYLFTYEPSKHRIIGLIDGYQSFSALQSDQSKLFSDSKVVKNISILKRMGSDGIKFVITLRKNVRANIFDVKNPGRIIINLFPL